MGIFKRIKHIVLADIHEVLDKAEDPISMEGQYLCEMEEQLARAQKAVADQLFLEKKYEIFVAETQAIIEKRVRQVNLAVDPNEDDIAKLASQDKIVREHKLASYKQQQETIQAQTANLYEKVKELKDKYEVLKLKQQELIARANAAKAVKASQATINSSSTDNAMRGFARMEERIWALKAGQAFAAHRQPSINVLLRPKVE